MAMIKLTGINKIYRTNEIETLALENVNLDVAKGEFVSIMGPSGCGKSTLLDIMGLLDAPSSGKIEINGTSVESMKDKELAAFRNKTLGFVFQSFHLINSLNVIDNVELPLLYRKMAAAMALVSPSVSSMSESQSPHLLRMTTSASVMVSFTPAKLAAISSAFSTKAIFRSSTVMRPSVAISSSWSEVVPSLSFSRATASGDCSRSWLMVSLST